ncbi:MAG: hypothetical protein CFE23_16325 [Flavobacterium sp. BFFFF1]|uniref:DUF2489 domain-containing protein n=1 Tax=Flavobacterium sp. BFFFF1 TaxID=2015557 RepID=UPI000BDA92A1|nr:DUF2489 domain-containing protein [Flavobacterium sp. BFFFF1]OYU78958.1 MAG: hypothetical protein CFE23_16325 [Flavobacterium sp. BFFFF1]
MKIVEQIKTYFFKTIKFGFKIHNKVEEQKSTEFDRVKRIRLIKKMLSNAIAINTNQIDIHKGCYKMTYLIPAIQEIEFLDNINLEIFENYYDDFMSYPIWEERKYYNKEYLAKLDNELNIIDQKYKQPIFDKCAEIIEKFGYIKNGC